jgi:hypothetical protein
MRDSADLGFCLGKVFYTYHAVRTPAWELFVSLPLAFSVSPQRWDL